MWFRARRGAASVAPVPTLSVTLPEAAPGSEPRRVCTRSVLPPGLPVLRQRGGGLLVLCPLMGEPDVEATMAQIIAQCPGAAVERTALTVAQLGRLAPLPLTWEDDTTAPQRASRPSR